MSGIVVAIDFEKAFDSLDHAYLLKFSMHLTLGHLLFNGSVLCIQVYQVVLSTMVSHQIILQLVEVCGKETHSHLFFSY